MMMNKKSLLEFGIVVLLCFASMPGQAQNRLSNAADAQYRRSSLYSLLVAHPEAKYASQIDYVYLGLPTPDKYEDHNLNVRRVEALTSRAVQPFSSP